jgi:hypothetical protein
MPVAVNISVPEIAGFNRRFVEYVKLSKKLPSQVIAEKSNALRIETFKEFAKHSWKEGAKTGAQDYGRLRHISGEGTRVRPSIRDKVRAGTAHRFDKTTKKRKRDRALDKNGKALYGQRLAVWLELRARSAGVGYLAASLLDRRYRKPRKNDPLQERRLVQNRNKKGSVMTVMELTPSQYSIQMWARGAEKVNARYNVAENALRNLNADMDVYLTRKANEAAQAALSRYK